ncbi:MAG: dihydroorotate dehydrogenase electron transfer subunit [Bacteroidetes bacterium]|nr:dihydroorotate dehydrogenase electron transfer subunit [Bacteroidota bacterium]
MQTRKGTVENVVQIGEVTFLIKVEIPEIAREIAPGQFCNIKVSETNFPLLRRPFSISNVKGNSIEFMIDVIGEGTKILATKKPGDALDILGPLGRGFDTSGDYKTAILVAGGIGLAPFPFLINSFPEDKNVKLFYGARSKKHIIDYNYKNKFICTDDGSAGFHGNVVDYLNSSMDELKGDSIKFFACGPTPMLAALKRFCQANSFDCEVSTESAMACGFGICQGCPIETTEQGYYKLICKDGPVFNISEIEL